MTMRTFPLLTAVILAAFIASAEAGSFGPGPWANGAYYPGQFDGKYSATVFTDNASTNTITGVLGFAQKAGSPTIVTNSTVQTNNTVQNTIIPDPWQNYFLIFFNGVTYIGTTFATINVDSKQVSGAMFDGIGRTSATNFAFASGGFTASLTSDKSPVTFAGNNTGQISITRTNATISYFSLNGIKVSDSTATSFDAQ